MNPLERLGTPEDIAAAVAFLVGPHGGWINGQVLRANGGMVRSFGSDSPAPKHLCWVPVEPNEVGSHIGRLGNEDILRLNQPALGLAVSPRTKWEA